MQKDDGTARHAEHADGRRGASQVLGRGFAAASHAVDLRVEQIVLVELLKATGLRSNTFVGL
jgi:hypothetical protein